MGLQARAIEAQVNNVEADTTLKIAQATKEAGEAFVFGMNFFYEYFYIVFISEVLTGIVASFVMHLLSIGWKDKFGPISTFCSFRLFSRSVISLFVCSIFNSIGFFDASPASFAACAIFKIGRAHV